MSVIQPQEKKNSYSLNLKNSVSLKYETAKLLKKKMQALRQSAICVGQNQNLKPSIRVWHTANSRQMKE